jgi:hypothetical protein
MKASQETRDARSRPTIFTLLVSVAAMATFFAVTLDRVHPWQESDRLLAFSLAFLLAEALVYWMGPTTPDRLAAQFACAAAWWKCALSADGSAPMLFTLVVLPILTLIAWLASTHPSRIGRWGGPGGRPHTKQGKNPTQKIH